MNAISPEFETECGAWLDKFFASHPDAAMQQRAHKALRLLRAREKPLKGNTNGWAAGIIYAVTNDGRFPCGVPGVLNSDFVKMMNVSMETTRRRAAVVREMFTF